MTLGLLHRRSSRQPTLQSCFCPRATQLRRVLTALAIPNSVNPVCTQNKPMLAYAFTSFPKQLITLKAFPSSNSFRQSCNKRRIPAQGYFSVVGMTTGAGCIFRTLTRQGSIKPVATPRLGLDNNYRPSKQGTVGVGCDEISCQEVDGCQKFFSVTKDKMISPTIHKSELGETREIEVKYNLIS